MTSSPVQQEILVRAQGDWVMFHELLDLVREGASPATREQLEDRVFAELTPLLACGWLTVGDVTEAGFEPWDLPSKAALMRIRKRWQELSRAPDLGDVCWFDLTEDGEAVLVHPQGRVSGSE